MGTVVFSNNRPMSKFLKYGLLTLGVAVLLAAGVAAYIAATFDPNDYKAQVIQLVKERTQRTLRLDGDIKLAFYPSIGADLSRVSLSEFNSDKEFAALDSVHVSLALMPLLSRQVVVNEVSVSGLKVALVKSRDGKTNIDDLLNKEAGSDTGKPASGAADEPGAQPVTLDIAAVRVEKSELDFRDESSGAQYALQDIALKTGRISGGAPTRVEFSATLRSGQPKLDIATQLKTMLTLDLDKPSYRLTDLDLQVTGSMPGISDLAAHVAIPELAGDAQSFNSDAVTLEFGIKQPQQEFNLKLASPVSGDLKSQRFSLPGLVVAIDARGDKLPNKSVSSEMKGSVQLDAKSQHVQVDLAGGLLQSKVNAKIAVAGFSDPAIRFDIDVDQFDADMFMPQKNEGTAGKSTAAAAVPAEQPLDLSALRKLNLEGSLRIGTLKVANIKSSQLRLEIKAHNGVLNLKPLSGNLYQGSMNGSVAVNASAAKPLISINQSLVGISIAPLLKDAADFDALEGKGNVTLKLDTQGGTVTALKQGLNGNMALNLADGAIKGINIAGTLRRLGNSVDTRVQAADSQQKTDFSALSASFRVNNGVAHNDDLLLKSPLLRLTGSGDIDIGHDSINYLAKATLAKTLEGQGGKDSVGGITVPVRLSGPFTDLKYSLDFGAMVTEAARQKIEAKKEEVKDKLMDQLKGGLKGLFK